MLPSPTLQDERQCRSYLTLARETVDMFHYLTEGKHLPLQYTRVELPVNTVHCTLSRTHVVLPVTTVMLQVSRSPS